MGQDPGSISAIPVSNVQIDLSVTDNGVPDNIVVIFNLTGVFTQPTDGSAPTAPGTILAGSGGTIVYDGAAANFSHTGLTPNKQYFYKAFSYDGANNYSSPGIIANATTFPAAPTANAATVITTSGFNANWTGSVQGSEPFTYQIDYSTNNTFGSGVTTISGISSGTLNISVSGLPASTTYYYRVYSKNATGLSTYSNVITVITSCIPPAAPTPGDNDRCGTGSVTITATPGSGETIDWYNASTGGALLLSGNTSFTTPSISTTTQYYAETRNSTTGCISSTRTAVTATVTTPPTTATVTTTPLNYCALTSGSLGGNTPIDGTGAWTKVSGPGTVVFSAPSSGTSTATVSVAGTYVFRWTISNGSCTSSTADITVNYYDTPTTATVTTPTLNYCALTSGSLGGNTPIAGTGAWTKVSGPGTVIFSAPSSGTSTATVSVAGTYVFRWTISNGTCTSSTADVTVNYYATPTTATVTTTPLNYCALTSGSLGGNTPATGTGAWTTLSGPGTVTFSAPSSGTSTATVSVAGTYVFRWTISNGTCTPSTA